MDLRNTLHGRVKYFKRRVRLKFEIICISLYTQSEGCLGVIQGFSNFIPFKKTPVEESVSKVKKVKCLTCQHCGCHQPSAQFTLDTHTHTQRRVNKFRWSWGKEQIDSVKVHYHMFRHDEMPFEQKVQSREVGKQFIDPKIKAIYFFSLLKCVVKNSLYFFFSLSPQSAGCLPPAPKVRLFNELFCHVVDVIDSGGRKMVWVWAVTVYPQGGLRVRGKLHLPRSCVCKKFPQSHSQRKFTSESTSALHKARHSQHFHLDINLLSLPHGTSLFPSLSQSK